MARVTVYYWAPGYIKTTAVGDSYHSSSITSASLYAFASSCRRERIRMSPGHLAIGVIDDNDDSYYLSISYDYHQGKTRNLIASVLYSLPVQILSKLEDDVEMFAAQDYTSMKISFADPSLVRDFITQYSEQRESYFNLLAGSYAARPGSNCSSIVLDALIAGSTGRHTDQLRYHMYGVTPTTPQSVFDTLKAIQNPGLISYRHTYGY